MEVKRIEVVKNWLKPKSLRDIQIFLNFANFYWSFIQSFNKIAKPLILMLKTSPTQSINNWLLLIDMAENPDIGIDSNNCKYEMDKRSPGSKNLNKNTGNLIVKRLTHY